MWGSNNNLFDASYYIKARIKLGATCNLPSGGVTIREERGMTGKREGVRRNKNNFGVSVV